MPGFFILDNQEPLDSPWILRQHLNTFSVSDVIVSDRSRVTVQPWTFTPGHISTHGFDAGFVSFVAIADLVNRFGLDMPGYFLFFFFSVQCPPWIWMA